MQVISQVNAVRAPFPRALPDMLIIIRARGDPRSDVLTAPHVNPVTLLFIEIPQFTYGELLKQIIFSATRPHYLAKRRLGVKFQTCPRHGRLPLNSLLFMLV